MAIHTVIWTCLRRVDPGVKVESRLTTCEEARSKASAIAPSPPWT